MSRLRRAVNGTLALPEPPNIPGIMPGSRDSTLQSASQINHCQDQGKGDVVIACEPCRYYNCDARISLVIIILLPAFPLCPIEYASLRKYRDPNLSEDSNVKQIKVPPWALLPHPSSIKIVSHIGPRFCHQVCVWCVCVCCVCVRGRLYPLSNGIT